MIRTQTMIFQNEPKEKILALIEYKLNDSNDSPFWVEKALPFSSAVLDVLTRLRDQNLLFTPEGKPVDTLDEKLFLSWCDLYSLKLLAFQLQRSNKRGELVETRYDKERTARYKALDLTELGTYLSKHMIDLHNEMIDFPATQYNLHIGISDLLKKVLA